MAFKGSERIETIEEEVARLAQAPKDSTNYFLSTLPVLNTYLKTGMVIRVNFDLQLVVALTAAYPRLNVGGNDGNKGKRKILHDRAWKALVLASEDSRYPAGCEIVLQEERLRRCPRIKEEALLSLRTQ